MKTAPSRSVPGRLVPGSEPDPLPVVLVTGFEPFGGDDFNPSIEIARRLDGWVVRAGPDWQGKAIAQVHGEEMPCVFGDALAALDQALRRYRPRIVVALGLAASRLEISVERVAINVDDARIADNAGRRPIDVPVRAKGPAAYWSTLPIKAIVAAIRAAGLPVGVSHSAGTFVCNHLFYGLSHRIAQGRARERAANRAAERRVIPQLLPQPLPRGGFIHVPMPGVVPGLTVDRMVDAIRIAIRISVEHGDSDLAETGGAVD